MISGRDGPALSSPSPLSTLQALASLPEFLTWVQKSRDVCKFGRLCRSLAAILNGEWLVYMDAPTHTHIHTHTHTIDYLNYTKSARVVETAIAVAGHGLSKLRLVDYTRQK